MNQTFVVGDLDQKAIVETGTSFHIRIIITCASFWCCTMGLIPSGGSLYLGHFLEVWRILSIYNSLYGARFVTHQGCPLPSPMLQNLISNSVALIKILINSSIRDGETFLMCFSSSSVELLAVFTSGSRISQGAFHKERGFVFPTGP